MNKTSSVPHHESHQEMKPYYLGMLNYIERLHRLLLDVIKAELERVGVMEINSVQGLLLYNVGDIEVTAGELKSRGYYQGSNVSYNLKKLVDMGYIHYERSHIDRRSVRVKLTEKGQQVHSLILNLFDNHVNGIIKNRLIDVAGLEDICLVCKDFERFWGDDIRSYDR